MLIVATIVVLIPAVGTILPVALVAAPAAGLASSRKRLYTIDVLLYRGDLPSATQRHSHFTARNTQRAVACVGSEKLYSLPTYECTYRPRIFLFKRPGCGLHTRCISDANH